MPVWRRMSGPCAAMGGSGPNDYRVEGSAIGCDTFNRSDYFPLHSRSSRPTLFFANQDSKRTRATQHDSCLIHVIHVGWVDGGIMEFRSNYREPFFNFATNIVVVLLSVDRFRSPCLDFWCRLRKPRAQLGLGCLAGQPAVESSEGDRRRRRTPANKGRT